MHAAGGTKVIIIGIIQFLHCLALVFGGEHRMRVQMGVMVVNPAIKVAAGSVELRPLLRISHQGVVEQRIVQAQQAAAHFSHE